VTKPRHAFDLFDVTLRDGLQSPSVVNPKTEEKMALVEQMDALGLGGAEIGLPGAGRSMLLDVAAVARHAADKRLAIALACAARTVPADVAAVVEASQRSGRPLMVYTFIGSSRLRQWVEGWSLEDLTRTARAAIALAVREGLEVAFVTEDTTRSSPKDLEVLFRAALDLGVSRLVLCDTVGHATPHGTRALVDWTRRLIDAHGSGAKVDWHGHDDRGLALANAIAAIGAGADRVHGCVLKLGERTGNTPIDQLLVNLQRMGWLDANLAPLAKYVDDVARACRVSIPRCYPRMADER
jgi:2-isopropylmalate synthase